jgi:hypothetical protein
MGVSPNKIPKPIRPKDKRLSALVCRRNNCGNHQKTSEEPLSTPALIISDERKIKSAQAPALQADKALYASPFVKVSELPFGSKDQVSEGSQEFAIHTLSDGQSLLCPCSC